MQELQSYHIIIFSILGLIVFILAMYLGVLYSKLNQQKVKNKEQQELLDKKIEEQDIYFKDSIVSISRATLNGQCELSEACLRIVNLLKYYPNISNLPEYEVLHEMFSEIKEFAVLEERKKLPKQEIYNQDKKRIIVEKKYEEKALKSLESLQKQFEKLLN